VREPIVLEERLKNLSLHLKSARKAAGLTQPDLAKLTGIARSQIAKAETGRYVPNLIEADQLARALRLPWERLVSGRFRPPVGLRGIGLELYHLGITDLRITDPHVPGAFRRPEQVLALALRGDRPDTRVVEAIPFVLARQTLSVRLTLAFSDLYDKRIRTRLAWLSDITLTLDRTGKLPIAIESENQLSELIRRGRKPKRSDDLGIPSTKKVHPIWSRWNITYAGQLADFSGRAIAVARSYEQTSLAKE
jgi:transcriptional regulator with XRE-family HTH domain